jgi:hypothetical protein
MTASVGLSSTSPPTPPESRRSAARTALCKATPMLRGKEFLEYLEDDPEFADLFNEAMTGPAGMAEATVIAGYDVSSYATIVDVGGGHGRLQAGILAAVPGGPGRARKQSLEPPQRCGNGGRGPRTRRGGRSSTACQQAGTHTS